MDSISSSGNRTPLEEYPEGLSWGDLFKREGWHYTRVTFEDTECPKCHRLVPHEDFRGVICKHCDSEKQREYQKKYRETARGREVRKANTHRRRARKLNAIDDLTNDEWLYALDYFNHNCAVCGRPRGLWHTLAADHWIPLVKGGGTTKTNIIPLCHGQLGCNNSKLNKDPEQWVRENYSKSKAGKIIKRINAYFKSLEAEK
jgi:hypothetical protein